MRRLKSNMTQQLCFAATLVALAALLSATVTAEPMSAIKGQDSFVIPDDQNAAEIRKTLAADDGSNGCSCAKHSCTCCVHLDVFKWHETGCVNITYIPSHLGLGIAFILNGRIVYQTEVSVRNPPPICFGVPYLSKYASICLDFYNITWKEHIGGCVKLAVKLFHIIKKSFKMGCFNFNHLDEESKMAISRVLHELRQVQILRNQAELRMKKFDHLIL